MCVMHGTHRFRFSSLRHIQLTISVNCAAERFSSFFSQTVEISVLIAVLQTENKNNLRYKSYTSWSRVTHGTIKKWCTDKKYFLFASNKYCISFLLLCFIYLVIRIIRVFYLWRIRTIIITIIIITIQEDLQLAPTSHVRYIDRLYYAIKQR